MARPNEIAADARALYGPPAVRPAAGAMGDGALWVDPGNNQSVWQVQSGNWVRIALPDADTDTDDDSAPSPLDVRHDSFKRPDQDGWGTASDGGTWRVNGGYGTASIASQAGVLGLDGGYNIDTLVLEVPLSAPDAEVLVRWAMTSLGTFVGGDAAPGVNGPLIFMHAPVDVDIVSGAEPNGASPRLNGNDQGIALEDSDNCTWSGAALDDLCWTRFRYQRGRYHSRSWRAADAEPPEWQGNSPAAAPSDRCAGITLMGYSVGVTLTVSYFSVIELP